MRSRWAVIGIPTVRSELSKCGCSVLALTLAILIPAIGVAAEKPQYFSIKMNDKLVGYAVVDSETVTRDGRTLLRLRSETSLKVALLGKERNTLLKSETLIDPKKNRPAPQLSHDRQDE